VQGATPAMHQHTISHKMLMCIVLAQITLLTRERGDCILDTDHGSGSSVFRALAHGHCGLRGELEHVCGRRSISGGVVLCLVSVLSIGMRIPE
jgi:hypothetical protein